MSATEGPMKVKGTGEVTLGPVVKAEWELVIRLVTDHVTDNLESGLRSQHYYAGRATLIQKLEQLAYPPQYIEDGELKIGGTD